MKASGSLDVRRSRYSRRGRRLAIPLFVAVALVFVLSGTAEAGAPPIYSLAVQADSPLGYWKLNESSGAPTPAVDASGNGFNGQYRNVNPGSPGAILRDTYTAASFNAFSDSLHNDEVYVGSGADPGFAGTPFSAELWVATSTITGDRPLVGSSLDGHVPDWFIAVTDDLGYEGRVRTLIVSGGVSKVHYGPGIPVNDGQFHHVVATLARNGSSEVYVDGVPSGTSDAILPAPIPPVPSPTDSIGLTIGDVAGSPQFVGQIDEAAIYSTPLSASSVLLHRAAGDYSLPIEYTYDAAVFAGIEVPPTASEAGLPVCPVDQSGFDGFSTAEEADAAGDEASLHANDEPECVPDRSSTEVTHGGIPRHWYSPPESDGYHYHGNETEDDGPFQGARINVEVSDPSVDHTPDLQLQEFVVNRTLVKHDRITPHQATLEVGWEEASNYPDQRYVYTEWGKQSERHRHHSRHSQYVIGVGRFIGVRVRGCQQTGWMCADILWRRCNPTCRNRWELIDRNKYMSCVNLPVHCLYEERLEVFTQQANSPHPALNASGNALNWRYTKLRTAPAQWQLWDYNLDRGKQYPTPPALSPYNACWEPSPPYQSFWYFYVRRGDCF